MSKADTNKKDDFQPKSSTVKIIKISPMALASLLMENNKVEVKRGLPAGTKYIGSGYDSGTNQFFIHLENKRFEPVNEGDKIPDVDIELRHIIEIEDIE